MKSKPDKLFLTPEAESDILDILSYTIERWGAPQAEAYLGKLYAGFEMLIDNPLVGVSRDDILPGYRSLRIEKHFALYVPQDRRISVIRVLHVNRDIKGVFE